MNWLKHKLSAWLGVSPDDITLLHRITGQLELASKGRDRALDDRLRKLEAVVYAEQHTGVDMVVSRDEASHFILFGTYQGRDYVEVIPVQGAGFGELVDHARHMRRNSRHDFRVDAPVNAARQFRAALNRL